MARIHAARLGDALRVTITGRLSLDDMRRLEHACAPALTSDRPNLLLDLRGVTHADATATAVLERIGRRGARMTVPLRGLSAHQTDCVRPHVRPVTRAKKR
jgi:anti-anti-sigma regulatory factor